MKLPFLLIPARSFAATAFLVFATFNCVAQKPELVMQTGHTDWVESVAFSPDGKTLASGSDDETIKLWDVPTGTLLRSIEHTSRVLLVAFSPDGKRLASIGGTERAIKLWDIATGTELRSINDEERGVSYVYPFAFNPNGKALACLSHHGTIATIKVWDIATGTQLQTFNGPSIGEHLGSFAFSPDGKVLASGGDKAIRLWDVSTGNLLFSFGEHTINSDGLWTVVFSPDGRVLASGDDKVTKLWDVTTGALLHSLDGFGGIAFSSDGRTLASGSDDRTIKLWDILTGTLLRSIGADGVERKTVAFSPDGKTLASGGWFSSTVKLWDVTSGVQIRSFGGNIRSVNSAAFSPDGKILASGGEGSGLKLWDISRGIQRFSLGGDTGSINSVAFSPNGTILAGGGWVDPINLWDVSSGTLRRSIEEYLVESVAFSPDGKILASGGGWDSKDLARGDDASPIKLWDVETGVQLHSLIGHSSGVKSVAFSPDGNTLASGGKDSIIKLWNVPTGTCLRSLDARGVGVNSVVFSPDGRILASVGWLIKLWDVSSGAELRIIDGYANNAVAFSGDGKTLVTGGNHNTMELWDVATGTLLRSLVGHTSPINSVALSPDGKMLVSGGTDATTRLWDMPTGKALGSLISLSQNDWAVVVPSGLFDGLPNTWKQLNWRLDNNTFTYAPVEAFFKEFYYPGLLVEIMAGKQPKPPKKDLSAIDIRQPQVRVTRLGGEEILPDTPIGFATVAAPDSGRNVEVTLEVTDNAKTSASPAHAKSSGARDLRLFRNGSLVKLWPGDIFGKESNCQQISAPPPAPHRCVCTVTLTIVAGENRLTAYAFNYDDVKSSDATLTITGAESLKRKGVAYVLALGVNEYANSEYNLKYAVADASGFADELRRQQTRLNNYERVEVISLIDKDATKANILKSLAILSTKVQPEDALVIFFAGHGTAQQNRFYLIPYDLGYRGSRTKLNSNALQSILSHSISDEEIERAVDRIDAGQMLLVIDACNSGQALEAEEKRRGPMNSKGLAQLAYEKGMYILTAAQSYQAANEAERYGHGFLTYALVEEGLKTGAADREPKDGQVLLREWLDFAMERVPQLQQNELDEQKKQGRQLDRIKFAESDSGNERRLQLPRVFYRRETEPYPLIVAKP